MILNYFLVFNIFRQSALKATLCNANVFLGNTKLGCEKSIPYFTFISFALSHLTSIMWNFLYDNLFQASRKKKKNPRPNKNQKTCLVYIKFSLKTYVSPLFTIKQLKCISLSNILSLLQDCDIGGADHCGIGLVSWQKLL